MALFEGAREMVWLQLFFRELGLKESNFSIFCDSSSAIFMIKHHTSQCHSKYIELRYQYIQHVVEEGKIHVENIDTKESLVDALTKIVTREKFKFCQASLKISKK